LVSPLTLSLSPAGERDRVRGPIVKKLNAFVLVCFSFGIKTFYPIRIPKGRRKQRRDLRGDILEGNKDRIT